MLSPDELIIDNFAGGGGASTGIFRATGRHPDIAINHDADAVAMHKANHPTTKHYCQNIWQAVPSDVIGNRRVGLAWFSPDCKHFSKAKGGKPVQKNIRDLAWVVIAWAKLPRHQRPRIICLENVEEFKTWGPLTEEGKPCPDNKGAEFHRWVRELTRLGYKVSWKELKACDYGAPTIRKRLFLVARCDGLPICWPKPTHGAPASIEVQAGTLKPWRTAAEIIDWSLPCPSIFLTREEALELRRSKGINCKRPLAEATMRRIARGLKRFVIDAAEPFVVTANHGGDWFRGNDLKEPFKTVTAARDAHGLVVPFTTAYYGTKDGKDLRTPDLQEPLRTQTTENRHALVTAFIVKHFGGMTGVEVTTPFPTITTRGTQNQIVAAHMMPHFGESVARQASEPVGSITASGGGKQALISSNLVKLRGTCKDGQALDEPMPGLTASGTHVGEVRALLAKFYGADGSGQTPAAPLHTIPTHSKLGVVTVAGELHQIIDVGMRMLSPRELFRAQGFDDDYIIDPDVNGKPITKSSQVEKCGNSVCPDLAEAVVGANTTQDVPVQQSQAPMPLFEGAR